MDSNVDEGSQDPEEQKETHARRFPEGWNHQRALVRKPDFKHIKTTFADVDLCGAIRTVRERTQNRHHELAYENAVRSISKFARHWTDEVDVQNGLATTIRTMTTMSIVGNSFM